MKIKGSSVAATCAEDTTPDVVGRRPPWPVRDHLAFGRGGMGEVYHAGDAPLGPDTAGPDGTLPRHMPDQRDDNPDDLDDVLREERHRGRRGIVDTAARRRNQRLKDGFRQLLRSDPSEEQLADALIGLGLEPGTKEFEECLRRWRQYRRSRT